MEGIDLDRIILKAIGSGFIALILVLIIYFGIWLWRVAKKAGKKSVEIGKSALDQQRITSKVFLIAVFGMTIYTQKHTKR